MKSELAVELAAKLLRFSFVNTIAANAERYFVRNVHLGEYHCRKSAKLLCQVTCSHTYKIHFSHHALHQTLSNVTRFQCGSATLAFWPNFQKKSGSARLHLTRAPCLRGRNRISCYCHKMALRKWVGIPDIHRTGSLQQ